MNSYSSAKPTITNPISNVLGSTTTRSASSVIGSTTSTTTTSGSFFSNMSWTTILLLILFFFFFGFGIFVYLAKGTESAIEFTSNIFVSTLQKIMHLFGNDSVEFSEEDTSATTEPTTTTSTTNIEKHMQDDHGVPGKSVTQPDAVAATSSETPEDPTKQDKLNKALNKATPNLRHKHEPSYGADDSYSSVQMSKSSSKSGWCFIGEDRGIRSCSQVGNNDKCMSGDIFPTQEICVNPKLRL